MKPTMPTVRTPKKGQNARSTSFTPVGCRIPGRLSKKMYIKKAALTTVRKKTGSIAILFPARNGNLERNRSNPFGLK